MVVKRKTNQWTMMIYALQEIEELEMHLANSEVVGH
jgi:hypothetical protein